MTEAKQQQVAASEIRFGEFVFTREDAIKLCRNWQDYEWGEPDRFTAANIENMIEELCFAFGFTVEEVRATWWRNRQISPPTAISNLEATETPKGEETGATAQICRPTRDAGSEGTP